MKILIIDNFDSFTYNLYQSVGSILTNSNEPFGLVVKRNNEITVNEIKSSHYTHIIISPGPGDPSDSAYFGVCAEVITKIGKYIPVLGVCLGMQGIGHYFGGHIIKAKLPMHGKTSIISHDGQGVFKGIPRNIQVMRYHSLVAEPQSLPSCLEITAAVIKKNKQNPTEIMGLRHKDYPIEGVQFHPESFATEYGTQLLRNFLKIV